MLEPLDFAIAVTIVALSGVLTPGPMFAITVAKGHVSKFAGVEIALGHGVVEFPLILITAFGLGGFLQLPQVKLFVGIIGGAFLVYMGYGMIRDRRSMAAEEKQTSHSPFVSGILATGANPHFIIWWATVGALLISQALQYGLIMVAFIAIIQYIFDLMWYGFVGYSVYKSKKLWSARTHAMVFSACGLLLALFGLYFIGSATSLF
ncbi:MAG: LysE family transporter [Candidatus Micrarchaeota archaeon]|nr:LysE family transporter [Candidatus Micrarchaeota archaeon]